MRRNVQLLLRSGTILGFLLLLAGCVVYPAGGPYWHPHDRYWYHY